ncbi:unnamed protein product, partial [Urochloa humidicola]
TCCRRREWRRGEAEPEAAARRPPPRRPPCPVVRAEPGQVARTPRAGPVRLARRRQFLAACSSLSPSLISPRQKRRPARGARPPSGLSASLILSAGGGGDDKHGIRGTGGRGSRCKCSSSSPSPPRLNARASPPPQTCVGSGPGGRPLPSLRRALIPAPARMDRAAAAGPVLALFGGVRGWGPWLGSRPCHSTPHASRVSREKGKSVALVLLPPPGMGGEQGVQAHLFVLDVMRDVPDY